VKASRTFSCNLLATMLMTFPICLSTSILEDANVLIYFISINICKKINFSQVNSKNKRNYNAIRLIL